MQTTIIRPSIKKRIIVTLIPFLSFICMYLLVSLCTYKLEYGSTAYHIVLNLGMAFFIPMFLSLPYILKANRQKITFDGYSFKVTPTIGCTKEISLTDVKVCNIVKGKKVVLLDENSNVICKYPRKIDRDDVVINALRRNPKCVFSATDKNDNQTIIKNNQSTHYEEDFYQEGELDINVLSTLSKIRRRVIIGLMVCYLLVPALILIVITSASSDLVRFGEIVILVAAGVVIWFMVTAGRKKAFEIIRPSFYQVSGLAVDENGGHVIYEFQDKYGEKRRRPSDRDVSSTLACGTRVGQRKILWYSPYAGELIEGETLKFKTFRDKERAPFKIWLKKHPVQFAIYTVIIIVICIFAQRFVARRMYIYSHDGRNLKTEWVSEDKVTETDVENAIASTGMDRIEYEKWLKQSYYPYFYVNDVNETEFTQIDIESARYEWDDETIQSIKDNLDDYWGITDRNSLIKTTDSLLEKGAKYTYYRTLKKMGEKEMNMPEDTIMYTYRLYKEDEWLQYMGTYKAYNEIGDAGIDAWDYCRCTRLFAFGYICGYISYDEYLIHSAPIVAYLQDEYDSWANMYESYYYGDLIFLGRNKHSDSGYMYGGYANYEYMGEDAEAAIQEFSR